MAFLRDSDVLSPVEVFSNKYYFVALNSILYNLDPATMIKLSVASGMFPSVLNGMGTAKHMKFLEQVLNKEVSPLY